jgi:hypothetical protein
LVLELHLFLVFRSELESPLMGAKTAKLAGFKWQIVKNNEKKWKILKKVLA